MFKLIDPFKREKCECCNGTGKKDFHLFKFDKEQVEIIKKTFPDFDPKNSCDHCLGEGKTDRFNPSRVFHELNMHILDKILDENPRRRRE